MKHPSLLRSRLLAMSRLLLGMVVISALGGVIWGYSQRGAGFFRVGDLNLGFLGSRAARTNVRAATGFQPRKEIDTSGFATVIQTSTPWPPTATLSEIDAAWQSASRRLEGALEKVLGGARPLTLEQRARLTLIQGQLFNSKGEPERAYEELERLKSQLATSPPDLATWLYSLVYFQGVCSLRRGETENCVMCRGESSCILPISRAAVHTNPEGSRRAIEHFRDYLSRFPDDLEVRWLLNIAHMTLGEYPEKVDPAYRISLDRWCRSEFDLGRFRNVSERARVNHFNQAGGAVMDDFDNDGLLDLAVTTWDSAEHMSFFHNKGDGTFEDRSKSAGVTDQLGGLYCVQADYDNDGWLDLYIPRGAWIPHAMRPTLLRNLGDGAFADVTAEAGLLDPVNSNSCAWADYDNDGLLDLFVCCERQPNRLYHNRGDGRFEEVAARALQSDSAPAYCKGATWIDFDNDRYPDLFLDILTGDARFFRNNRDGTFREATSALGIDGPYAGFSCWAWDYDNDGFLDIFATSYDRTLQDVVKGLIGEPHARRPNKLFRNLNGERFQDVTREAGLDMVFATMGSNFGDFDNDGFLDIYLATGEPNLATLIPNRMFKNVDGRRFSEITVSSGTGHLQKGHAVACGDWDRDGDVDLFVQTGGATLGDRYHNVLFENPGQSGNHWLTVKLVGKKTNRSAIGARIKVVTAGSNPQTVYRHVTSGSSFGGNPLEQMIGVGQADRVATLEITWPTSGTTQVFHDLAVNQAIEITEFADSYQKRPYQLPGRTSPH